jgi:hypothetical protein
MAGTQMTGGWTNQNVDDQSIKVREHFWARQNLG